MNKIVNLKFSITGFIKYLSYLFNSLILLLVIICFPVFLAAQQIAFLAPDKSPRSQTVRENLERELSANFRIMDDSLAESVPQSAPDQNIFNLSTENARNFGRALGCSFFVLVKGDTLRRATLSKPDFYIESYAVIYLVSARTGRLTLWKLASFKAPTAAESEKGLAASLTDLAAEIAANIAAANKKELGEDDSAKPEELPDENSADAKNFRSPLPYRRLRPEYTPTASLYNVTATVDATVDLDEQGNIKRVEINRWAGYGLDESVEATIRKMQWRAAERNGKSLPIRVLLRYNFKKIDHDDE